MPPKVKKVAAAAVEAPKLGPQVRYCDGSLVSVALALARMAEGILDSGLTCAKKQVREGENVFAIAHIYASFNDTFVHVTDVSGR